MTDSKKIRIAEKAKLAEKRFRTEISQRAMESQIRRSLDALGKDREMERSEFKELLETTLHSAYCAKSNYESIRNEPEKRKKAAEAAVRLRLENKALRRQLYEQTEGMRLQEVEQMAQTDPSEYYESLSSLPDEERMQKEIDRQMLRLLFEKTFGEFDEAAYRSDCEERLAFMDTYDSLEAIDVDATKEAPRVRIVELTDKLSDIRNYCSKREE